jgi:hypothetical protein
VAFLFLVLSGDEMAMPVQTGAIPLNKASSPLWLNQSAWQ